MRFRHLFLLEALIFSGQFIYMYFVCFLSFQLYKNVFFFEISISWSLFLKGSWYDISQVRSNDYTTKLFVVLTQLIFSYLQLRKKIYSELKSAILRLTIEK